jgi:hypothetical protein
VALNQVAVVGPRAESREPEKQEKDWWEKVMEGLQIAKSVTGIATDVQQYRKNTNDLQAQEDKVAGRMTPGELTDLQKTHDLSAEEPASPLGGAVKVSRRGEGDQPDTPLFATIRQKKEPAKTATGAWIETMKDGKKGKAWMPNGEPGAFVEAPPESAKLPKDISVAERNTLQNQFDRDPNVKKNQAVLQSFTEVQSLLQDPSPASDQALIYSYMKALDPGSVVRESEADSAQAIGTLQQRASAKFSQMASGNGMLDPAVRADLAKQVEKLAKNADKNLQSHVQQFSELAARRQVDTRDLRFPASPQWAPEQPKQNPGEAFAGPADGIAAPSVMDIEAELARRAKAGDPALKGAAQKGGFGK